MGINKDYNKEIALRDKFVATYMNLTGDNLLEYPRYAKDEYYIPLRQHLRKYLPHIGENDDIFSAGTFRNFIFYADKQHFAKATLDIIRSYINAVELDLKKEKSFDIEVVLSLKGAFLVDSLFIAIKEQLFNNYQYDDFYLKKNNYNCQWGGIIAGWDYPRSINSIVKQHLLDSFMTDSKILAVIHGNGGCGKSVFLRKLAVTCAREGLNIIWVSDVTRFCDFDLDDLSKSTKQFLVILEDWYIIRHSIELIERLLSRLLRTDNVQMVVGDRNPIEEKPYYRYLIEDGSFELKNDENELILEKVLSLKKDWHETVKTQLTTSAIKSCPIFILLFVISRVRDGERFAASKSLLNQFKEIITEDQRRIYKIYPGLAMMLYYWANISKEKKYWIDISWEAFLKLADFYNTNDKKSSQFQILNDKNPICKILLTYISLETFEHPALRNNHILNFNHDLLIEEGLSNPFIESCFYDNRIILEMSIALYEVGEISIANDFYDRLKKENNIFKNAEQEIFFRSKFEKQGTFHEIFFRPSYLTELATNQFILDCYMEAKLIKEEFHWEETLEKIFLLFFPRYKSIFFVNYIVLKIIINGCRALCFMDVFNQIQTDNYYLVKKFRLKRGQIL